MVDPSESIELRHLVALSAIASTGSFSRAAEQLGYTQSAISQQIARLEGHLGHQLVERRGGPRSIALTPAGQVLVRHADAVVARLHSARADLRALSEGTTGTLRVGCYQSVGAQLLPRILREFVETWPQVTVELHEREDDTELLSMVEGGALDLTFVALPMMPGPFAHRELLEDPYVAVVPKDSALGADGRAIDTHELDGMPPRIVGIAWHRDRYHLPAATSFIRVAQQQAYAVQVAAPGG